MWLLLSGEGPSDIGACRTPSDPCDLPDFRPGPMACLIDKQVEHYMDFSPMDCSLVRFVSETNLSSLSKTLHRSSSPALRGIKRKRETQYFERNARVLAIKAKELKEEKNDSVVAVLFRDSDGTHSDGRGIWDDKRNSMIQGFNMESFETGVPMVPKPKSEAWLLCTVQTNPYQHCARLENESGNDKATNPLKDRLDNATNGHLSSEDWCERIRDGELDVGRIDMPSFTAFRDSLEEALKLI